jgi:hypothetical protein
LLYAHRYRSNLGAAGHIGVRGGRAVHGATEVSD